MASVLIGFSGPPRIAGAIYEGASVVEARGERVPRRFAARGRAHVVEERLLVTGTIRFAGLTEGRMLGLLSDVSKDSWSLEARTDATGASGDTAVALTVRTTSALPLTSDIGRLDPSTGRPLADLVLTFRALALSTFAALGLSA